ncbi:hypothetical protein [Paenibacillus sp. XY044]|uniref:hypothetical protein n=1 Tax=Paenibacillus sp. XY044 TaxID=2026089 RepID=UPI00117CD12E|nr:hypothetical protein [Paenibacillus sp. XY044]
MGSLDRFENPYYQKRFPDPQEKEVMEYSTCSGCRKIVTNQEVDDGEVLDVYGMVVHDDYSCLKKAVEARTIYLDKE